MGSFIKFIELLEMEKYFSTVMQRHGFSHEKTESTNSSWGIYRQGPGDQLAEQKAENRGDNK